MSAEATNEITVTADNGAVVVEINGAVGDRWVWLSPADAREFAASLTSAADSIAADRLHHRRRRHRTTENDQA